MARLTVMGDYQGPGERKTAETLARDLPATWEVIAGRKLSGPGRDDLDLVVVGERAIFVLEEKSWGPEVCVGDQIWRVHGDERRNPLDRVSYLARVLAGQLVKRVPGYGAATRGRHLVVSGVILSHDELKMRPDSSFADGDVVRRLSDATAWLVSWDASFSHDLAAVRNEVITFLHGLSQRKQRPGRIGPYEVVEELAPVGPARCFHARDAGRIVILRCYPMHGWGPDSSPKQVIERERLALDRLEERDRTWLIHPSFEHEARQWIVVPVVPAKGKSLATSLRIGDPARSGGELPRQVAIDVVTDAFRGLAEVCEVGLVHRGLCPKRVFLGRQLRVKFSDFYLARISGVQTISPELFADADLGTPYRAPECRECIGLASPASDVFSLALSLAGWVLGDVPVKPDVAALRLAIADVPIFGEVLNACLDEDPQRRPMAAQAAQRVEQALSTSTLPPSLAGVAMQNRIGLARRKRQSSDGGAGFHTGGVISDRYEILESLGHGGFARTWKVRDTNTEALRVIKQFHDEVSPDFARLEYAVADQFKHDNCARVYDMDTRPPGYLVLEYVPGENLKRFAGVGRPDAMRYRIIALDVLAGLAYLHGHGWVHRDITPTNVIVSDEGRAKIIDFGVSGPIRATTVVGTPPFTAPELRAGKGATQQSDLYGFAVTMIFTMLGRYPYAGDPARDNDHRDELIGLTDDERQSWGPLGAAMLDLLFTAARADPAGRPPSADELANDLRLLDDIPPVPGSSLINPAVDQLRGLYRASTVGNSGNRGLDDGFARATYVPTLLDTSLLPAVIDGDVRLVLLTGNPGDGKTSFLVQVGEELRRRGAEVVREDAAGWRLRLDGHTYVAVYDASESHDGKSSDELMCAALDPAPDEDPVRHTVLLAINDGRLLQFFDEHEDLFKNEADEVRRQLVGQPPRAHDIALIDLKRRTLAPTHPAGASLAGRILDTFTDLSRWAVCLDCLSRGICPMTRNARQLRGPAREAVEELVATSHLRRHRRATFRDVRSALAWLISGDRSCENVHAARERGMDLRKLDDALVEDLAFHPGSSDYLIQEWADLDPARTVAPDVERAARTDRSIVADPAMFTQRDRQQTQRRLYFGLWASEGLGRSTVRAYRHLDEFEAALTAPAPDSAGAGSPDRTRARVLLGLSRLLGAPGYRGENLAVADQGAGGTWAVLKEIPASKFALEQVSRHCTYVESRPDALRLRHNSGAALSLTLDTAELVLRLADGDLISDSASDSVRQEIETFAAALRHSPARAVRIVNPAGAARRAVVHDRRIRLETV